MRDPRVVLAEIADAISLAREATAGLDLTSFECDRIRSAATHRALEIISEAVRRLPDALLDRHPTLPWRDIKAIGNKLRHEYHRVDAKVIWDIVTFDLDTLAQVVEQELGGT